MPPCGRTQNWPIFVCRLRLSTVPRCLGDRDSICPVSNHRGARERASKQRLFRRPPRRPPPQRRAACVSSLSQRQKAAAAVAQLQLLPSGHLRTTCPAPRRPCADQSTRRSRSSSFRAVEVARLSHQRQRPPLGAAGTQSRPRRHHPWRPLPEPQTTGDRFASSLKLRSCTRETQSTTRRASPRQSDDDDTFLGHGEGLF